MKYVLGTVDNNINKKTIVSALIYCDEYKMFSNQRDFITYLSTVETNTYFRNRGLYYDLISSSFRFIKPNQTKIATPLKLKSDVEKVDEIKKRPNGVILFDEIDKIKDLNDFDEIEDFEYIVVSTEIESLVLEINLIKKYNPK